MRSLILVALAFSTAAAQSGSLPPIRKLPAPLSTTEKTFKNVAFVRALSNGKLLVNDVVARRVTLVDTSLRTLAVVADSIAGAGADYGPRAGGLIPYLADSTLFIDSATPIMYMIDPAGKIARTMSVPVAREATWMAQQSALGQWPGSDARGRVLYRGSPPRGDEPPLPKPGEWVPYSYPDTIPMNRVDFSTRKAETVAWFKTSGVAGVRTASPTGGSMTYVATNPLPVTDDATVMDDGTIVILKSDYHLEFIDADGKTTSTPKIPHPWIRMSDDDKVALIDSVKNAAAVRQASGNQSTTMGNAGVGGAGPGGRPNFPQPPADLRFVKPTDLPDYRPAFRQGALRAEPSGNLWIRTLQPASAPNATIYDIVNRSGKLVDRVELPSNRSIVGFDGAYAVYLFARDGAAGFIERVSIR
jgi:hypothetical protein